MMRLVSRTLLLSLLSSGAMAQSSATPAKHLRIYRTEHSAQQRCPSDKIVWANTTSRTLHLPGDPHHAHTHGGLRLRIRGACQGLSRTGRSRVKVFSCHFELMRALASSTA
jgi:hypothetical protein